MIRRTVCILAALATLSVARAASAQVDVIRGRVTTVDSIPIPNATVTVTSIPGGVNRAAKTDRNGRYTITFPNGENDYLVRFTALSYAPRQYELKRAVDEEILIADARLSFAANVLDAVHVVAPRDRAARNDTTPDISGAERTVNTTVLSADQLGDLAAMAASIAGVDYVAGANGDPSGFSVLGLGMDQNSETLNGMNSGAMALPRDAQIISTITPISYDVSKGGFSGAQQATKLRSGSNFVTQTASVLVAVPPLQFTTPAARALGMDYTQLSPGGGSSGPISFDKAFYNFSYQLGQTSRDLSSLLNTDSLGFVTAGISPDSVVRLLGILKAQHIPLTVGAVPSQRLTDNGSFTGQIDFAPPASKSGAAYSLTMTGAWNRASPFSAVGTSELPAHSADQTHWSAQLQFHHSTYFGFGILSETGVAVNAIRRYVTPFVALPGGGVQISSNFPDGSDVTRQVVFGGSNSQNTSTYTTTVDVTNLLSWFSEKNEHRIKLFSELQRTDFALNQTSNTLGTFYFNSLGDLAAGTPSQFTRTLGSNAQAGGLYIAGLALGDAYRPSNDLQIQYGVRLDANQYVNSATLDPVVQEVFGTANNNVPDHVFVSPRIGFSYKYGTAPQISGFDGAVRGARAIVQGGIGIFQGWPSPTLLAGPMASTGLANALQQLTCAGAATPTPDWAGYATNQGSIPSQCASGGAATPYANSAPNVVLAAKDYTSARSVRGNLQWSGSILGNLLNAAASGIYSVNLNQPETVDLNFNSSPRFTLASEANRPVFVNPTSIDPASGVIAAGDGRVSPLFDHVSQLRTDLTSTSTQLQLQLTPSALNTKWTWNVTYTYHDLRAQTSGFTSTVGNPLDPQWSRGSGWQHQIQYTLWYNFFDAVRVSWWGRVQSGTSYTPTVQGDINGDGYANSRAFIFDPAHTADPALAASMQSLLSGAPSRVRGCLLSQLGQLAGLNSCAGPWITTATMNIAFNSLAFHLPQRAGFSLSINNPLGAADLALHGANHLQGWGETPFIDNNLLAVRGFDRANERFIYTVNQRFGSSSTAFNAVLAPVSVVALLRWDTGPTRERQSLMRALDHGRTSDGTRAAAAALKQSLGTNAISNPLLQIVAQASALKLTGKQADSVATLNLWYTARVDSIWVPVANALANLPASYDHDAAYARYRAAREATVDLLLRIAPGVTQMLTAEQRRKLPTAISTVLDVRYLQSIRSGTAGAGGNPF